MMIQPEMTFYKIDLYNSQLPLLVEKHLITCDNVFYKIWFSDSTDLLLFGGQTGSVTVSSIWRFRSKKNFWTRIGDMQNAASELAVTPVKGIRCFKWVFSFHFLGFFIAVLSWFVIQNYSKILKMARH
jgi:hypothetical protein